MIEIKCILKYDPVPLSGKVETMFKPWWMIATCEGDLTEYYAWHLKKRTGLILQRPAWGAHISVIRGEEPPNKELWKKHQDKEVTLLYDPNVRTNGDHWWMRVHCNELLDIREELGLPRFGALTLHLTLGRPIPRHEESSDYFHQVFKSFAPSAPIRPYMTQEEALKNLSLPPLEVKHKELKTPEHSDSMFRKECPNCETGLLMVKRNATTLALEKDDNCTYCGRRFTYTDIKENSITLEYNGTK